MANVFFILFVYFRYEDVDSRKKRKRKRFRYSDIIRKKKLSMKTGRNNSYDNNNYIYDMNCDLKQEFEIRPQL